MLSLASTLLPTALVLPAYLVLHHPQRTLHAPAAAPLRVSLAFGQKKQYRLGFLPGTAKQGFWPQRKRKRTWFRTQPQQDLPGPVTIGFTGFGLAAVFAAVTATSAPQRVRRDHGFSAFTSTARFAPDGTLEQARTRAEADTLLQTFRATSCVPPDAAQRVLEAALALWHAEKAVIFGVAHRSSLAC